eukprot:TRINITY_DN37204_c0_g1_i1.p1 TRINITY_DN37204_c0_g1~~TRINITY_DN37204_c0_g1_i1.p1  ORF type:complete len:199 (-),score=22.51 TRINITY_DN37204_c0_g1_i1:85-681(-)
MLCMIDPFLCLAVLLACVNGYRVRSDIGQERFCWSNKYRLKYNSLYVGFTNEMVANALSRTISGSSLLVQGSNAAVFDDQTKQTCGTYKAPSADGYADDVKYCLVLNDFHFDSSSDEANAWGLEFGVQGNISKYAYLGRSSASTATSMALMYDMHSDEVKEKLFKHDTYHEFYLDAHNDRIVIRRGTTPSSFQLECVQ